MEKQQAGQYGHSGAKTEKPFVSVLSEIFPPA
jgi:hypothetical protein